LLPMDSRQISPPRGGTARDAALRRASNLTKWVCVGAVALVGALAGFVAQAKPGHSTNSSGSGGSGAGSGSGASRPTQANVNNGGGDTPSTPSSPSLSPPAATPAPAPAPVPAPMPAPSVSGGS
jgi:hypothetical protein